MADAEGQPMSANPAPGGSARAIQGVAWLVGFRLFDRIAGTISFVVLARLLLPEHFGIVALATGVVALVEIMSSLGLDTVLVQTRKLELDHYDTAWTIQLGAATLCAFAVAVLAWPAALFLNEPRLTGVLLALSAAVLIEGAQSVRMVDFRREMRFDKEFVFLATRRTITVVVTISSAVVLRNEWALAIGLVTARVVGCVLTYILKPYRPRLSLARRAEFLHKSIWLLLSSIVLFARTRSADFTLGKIIGVTSVGAFTLASDLSTMVSNELVLPINRVALSDLSQIEGQKDVVARYAVITELLGVAITPLTLGLGACAPLLVPLLFGPSWALAGDVLEVVAVAALIAALGSNIGVPMISLGHYRFNALIQFIGAVTLLPMLIGLTLWLGAIGAAWATLIGNAITVLAALLFAKRAFDFGVVDFLRCVWRPVTAGAVMVIAVRSVMLGLTSLEPQPHAVLTLAAMVAVGAIVYPGALLAFWTLCGKPEGGETRMLRLVSHLLRRFTRGKGAGAAA
jgi:O-antigen/teichoic acid export membrane protein